MNLLGKPGRHPYEQIYTLQGVTARLIQVKPILHQNFTFLINNTFINQDERNRQHADVSNM